MGFNEDSVSIWEDEDDLETDGAGSCPVCLTALNRTP